MSYTTCATLVHVSGLSATFFEENALLQNLTRTKTLNIRSLRYCCRMEQEESCEPRSCDWYCCIAAVIVPLPPGGAAAGVSIHHDTYGYIKV